MNFRIFFLLGLLWLSASCSRNLSYLSETDEEAVQVQYVESIDNTAVPKIQPDDVLDIKVSSLSPESNTLFNQGVIATAGASAGAGSGSSAAEGYLVDSAGYIRYPVLGKVKVGGLTKEQAVQKLESRLQEYLREPVVNMRYLNYRVTILGEVSNPSTFILPAEKINILTALGMAGDLTVYGKRENVLLIREENGIRKMARINLNSRELLNSPYFYLQQNDVIYVEPVKTKEYTASAWRTNLPLVLSLVTTVTILFLRLSQ